YAFLAPEQKRFEQVGIPADIYAFGVLAYYLMTGQFPEGIFRMPSQVAPEYHYDWDSLVSQCLYQDPLDRPTELLPLLETIVRRSKLCTQPMSELSEAAPTDTYRVEKHQHKEATISEASEERAPMIDHLKSAPLRPPSFHSTGKEESELKPIIQRSMDKVIEEVATLEPVAISAACLSEKKESPAEQSENYAQQLSAMLNRDPVVTQYQPEKKEARDTEPLQTEMIVIRGGQFMRGSNSGNRDEMPRHKVGLESFAMDIHPVTNEQFVRFLEYMGGEKDQNYNDLIRLKDSRLSRSGGKLSIEPGYAKHPVVGVTWYGAVTYAKWAGKRLPTEAEWESAARGGHENCMYPTGDQIEKSQANFFSSDTTSVMSYAPNGYGLYDMIGNVYEWCQDWYGYNFYESSAQEPNNPKGPIQGVYRVLRGGCWKSLQEDMRCSHRHRNNPGTVNSTYGFRCAADVQ
ncbi:MAG TPA: SUMF1/EgtB/PvdO family nonheme iron enzyme, partial [Waddliaceae bacterium]